MSTTGEFRYEIESFRMYLKDKELEEISDLEILEFLRLREAMSEQMEKTFPPDLQERAMNTLAGTWVDLDQTVNLRTLESLLEKCEPSSANSMRETYRSFMNHALWATYTRYERDNFCGDDWSEDESADRGR